MPQRLSGKKELRKNKKRRQRNLDAKHKIKTAIKKFTNAIDEKDFTSCQQILKDVYKVLDKVAAKRLIHPNKAARKKSRIVKLFNKAKAAASSKSESIS